MLPKVFLSLSFVDANLVRAVHERLPRGLAYFYERSFDNGEALLSAMERAIGDTAVFVLFASKASLASKAVLFEIEQARLQTALGSGVRLMIFPTDAEVTYKDLPHWLQKHWMARAGYEATDVARYITASLLSPDAGLLTPDKVVGRGKTSDRLDNLIGLHLQKRHDTPNIIVLAGFSGIGRRTFANFYLRKSLSAEASLPFGPTLDLPPQADAADLYRALRNEISGNVSPSEMAADQHAFQAATDEQRTAELARLLGHFWTLGQAVTLVSSSGFFEDIGEPKDWLTDVLKGLNKKAQLILITTRQFDSEYLEALGNAIQLRVEELTDQDVETLMTYTAQRLGMEGFKAPTDIIRAIGGHADVANAAVRLASQRGIEILQRDPAQLLNVQRTILGDVIDDGVLTADERVLLDILCWVPSLGGDLLERTANKSVGMDEDRYMAATQTLIIACIVTVTGYVFSIAPSIRFLYRRRHVTPAGTTTALAEVLSTAWSSGETKGEFREDVFQASVFIHSILGQDMPSSLKNLISPGFLHSLVKEMYARAKNNDDADELTRVVSLGQMSRVMNMTEAVRQEILSTVARAQIRLTHYASAEETITHMEEKGYRSVPFLRGHSLRRQERYGEAVELLKIAVEQDKYNKAAVNELALAYHRSQRFGDLNKLLSGIGKNVKDSAILTDFQVGLDLASGQLDKVRAGIKRLQAMADDDGRSDRRAAQLLMREGDYRQAKILLTSLIETRTGSTFLNRTLRAKAAAWSDDSRTAQRDIDFVKGLSGREVVATQLQIELEAGRGELERAEALLSTLPALKLQDQLLKAKILELKAARSTVGLAERQQLLKRASDIRTTVSGSSEHYED